MSGRAPAVLVLAILLIAGPVAAHVVVTATQVQQILEQVTRLKGAAAETQPAATRAPALFELGEVIVRTADLLNRDVATHGGAPSLEAEALVAQLRARGFAFDFDEDLGRYPKPLEPLESALAFAPDDPRAPDARFTLLATRFYESFGADIFEPVGMDLPGLLSHVESAQAFLERHPDHQAHDEAAFMLAVDYARAARLAPEADARETYRGKAVDALSAYVHDHSPDELRAATARQLLEALEQ